MWNEKSSDYHHLFDELVTFILSRNQRIPLTPLEIGVKEHLPHLWVFRANLFELADAARSVIHGPIVYRDVLFVSAKQRLEIVEPLLELALGAESHTTLETSEADSDLSGVDDDALNEGGEDDLRSEGVEGHLVIWLETREICW